MGRTRSRAALTASIAILGAAGWPMLLGRVYGGDDLANFHLPLRAFYADCLASGDRFEWCPKLFCGFDLHGEGQVGMYHPLHLGLYGLLPLATAFNLELLSSYFLMFRGTASFLTRRGLPRDAGLFGAMAFTFSGFNVLHYMHPNFVMIVAHLPWLLLASDAMARGGRSGLPPGPTAAVALLTASELLISYPQAFWLSGLAEACYAGWIAASSKSARPLAAWLVAKAIGVLIGCVQLVPTWDALAHSIRAEPSAAFLSHGSLHPANLIQLVGPYLFRDRFFTSQAPGSIATHELGIYAGSTAPVLLGWLWIRRRDLGGHRPLAIAAMALGGLSLLLAIGRHGPAFEWMIRLPLVGLFRNPGRSIVLFHLAIAALAAIALADLGQLEGRIPWRKLGPMALAPALSVALASGAVALAWARPDGALAPSLAPAERILIGPMLVGMATALALAAARGRRGALVALIVFAAADQAAYGLTFAWRSPPSSIARLLESRPVPAGAVGHRVKVGEGDNLWIMNGVGLVDGYVALTPSRRLHYEDRSALKVAGVRWIRANAPDAAWSPLPGPLPRARLVTESVHRRFGGPDFDRATSPSFAFTTEPLTLPGGEPGDSRIVVDRPGRIQIATASETRQLLVVSERISDGWHARVDGREAPVLRVDGDFLGCVVEPGEHSVEFRYDPRSLKVGAWLSGAGLGLLALVALIPRLRRRGPMAGASP